MTYFRANEQVIDKFIANLKLSKCPGSDEISPRLLKMTMDKTRKPLFLIFNRLLIHGEITGDLKSAKKLLRVIKIIIDQLV